VKKIILFSFFIFHFFLTQGQHKLFGLTESGGIYSQGVLFSYDPLTNKDSVFFNFNGTTQGGLPCSDLLLASNGLLYGMTYVGGLYNDGVLFSFNIDNGQETVLVNFDSATGFPQNGGNQLIQGTNGLLYGSTFNGGAHKAGVIFSYDINMAKDSVLFNFDSLTSGAAPCRGLYQDITTGILYGTTEYGGKNNYGVLYSFNPSTLMDTVLIYFDSVMQPHQNFSRLTLASNGLLYSLGREGGDSNEGVIYDYDISHGSMQVLFSFDGIAGGYPLGNELMQASNNLLYGMTNSGDSGYGILFSFNTATNIETVLVNFNNSIGGAPYGNLVQNPDNGFLYGMTYEGGLGSEGVFFSYDTSTSTYTKIFDFNGANGESSVSSLIIVNDSEKITTGINEIKGESEKVKVYPNPNSGIFNIELIGAQNPGSYWDGPTIEIYNVLGEKILTGKLAPQTPKEALNEIDISAQPSGIYSYRVLQPSGECIGEGKVIVQR
jgi:uncharacterized repeat protein (TIGR03803 family)